MTNETVTVMPEHCSLALHVRPDRFDGGWLRDFDRWQRLFQHIADKRARHAKAVAGTVQIVASTTPTSWEWAGMIYYDPFVGVKWWQIYVPEGFYVTRSHVDKWARAQSKINFSYEMTLCA